MYEARQNKEKKSRILSLSKPKGAQLLKINSNKTIQRVVEQYQGGNINNLLVGDVSFVTQGITCDFKKGGKRNGANWISETTKVRTPILNSSHQLIGYVDMACHLNITYRGGVKDTERKTINITIDNKTMHWTIRSIQDQKMIDEIGRPTTDADYAFHKSSGKWNIGDKEEKKEGKTIEKIGVNPNLTRLSNVNISETKNDLANALAMACGHIYNYRTTIYFK